MAIGKQQQYIPVHVLCKHWRIGAASCCITWQHLACVVFSRHFCHTIFISFSVAIIVDTCNRIALQVAYTVKQL